MVMPKADNPRGPSFLAVAASPQPYHASLIVKPEITMPKLAVTAGN